MKLHFFLTSLLFTILLLGCNKAKDSKTQKDESVIAIDELDGQNENVSSRRYAVEKEPENAIIIRDTTSMGCANEEEMEYVIGDDYIGCRTKIDGDTVRQGYLTCLFPPKVMDAIFEKGEKIIPLLINSIDIDDEMGRCGYINPYYSDISGWVLSGPVGINYAYMIELILSKDSIEHTIGVDPIDSGWEKVMRPYLLYKQCVIVKKDNLGNPIIGKLKVEDMRTIKKLYFDWWEENKHSGIKEMRKQWRKKHIFENQRYMWI